MTQTLRLDPNTAELEQVKGGCEITFPVSIYMVGNRLGAVTIQSVEELIDYVRENGGQNFSDTELVAYVQAFCAPPGSWRHASVGATEARCWRANHIRLAAP